MNELDALAELLLMLVTDRVTGVLMALLLLAAVLDWRTMRIPNWLTVAGMAYGLAVNTLNATSMAAGFAHAGLGLLVGLVLLLPLWLLRVMGAGDVKLMAMVGAFLGPVAVLKAVLVVFIVGGVAALAFTLARRASGQLADNMRNLVFSMVLRGVPLWRPGQGTALSVGRLPYGICICAGTIGFVVARQLGFL